MIIDDDQSIRDRLKKIIDWKAIGISFSCEAQDSDTARELFLLYRPKIIITDINIPIISGLELANEIIEVDPDVRFIVITGYSDFEYVKSSVKLGAVDLISKPILPEDINESLKKAVNYFNKLKAEQSSVENLKILLEESLPTYREKFIYYLLNQTRSFSEEQILRKFDSLQLDIKGRYYAVALISPDINAISAPDMDLFIFSVKNVSDEILNGAGFKTYSFYDNNYRLNCLLSWNFENGNELLEETIQRIYEKVIFFWDIKIYAGIGMPVSDLTKLHDTRNEAYIALNYQGVLSSGPIINYYNIKRLDMPIITDSRKAITSAINCFKNDDLSKMNEIIKEELATILSSNKDSTQTIRKFIFEIISSIFAESISLGIKAETILKYNEIYEKVFSIDNIQMLSTYVLDLAENLSTGLFQKRSKSKNTLIQMAKDFILINLGDENLNLDMVSRHISLSSIYFCKLFHKEEGISFNDYLNLQRVNKAKSLLRETGMKVFEICYATGYSNPKYFNYVFKRIADRTPLEYRNSAN